MELVLKGTEWSWISFRVYKFFSVFDTVSKTEKTWWKNNWLWTPYLGPEGAWAVNALAPLCKKPDPKAPLMKPASTCGFCARRRDETWCGKPWWAAIPESINGFFICWWLSPKGSTIFNKIYCVWNWSKRSKCTFVFETEPEKEVCQGNIGKSAGRYVHPRSIRETGTF